MHIQQEENMPLNKCPNCKNYYDCRITGRSYGGCELGLYPPVPAGINCYVINCKYFKLKKNFEHATK